MADFPFAAGPVARLEHARRQAVEDRIEADLAVGRHAAVVGELEALVRDDPLRERLWAHLMTALYRCDRQADALEAYSRARRHLVEELGLEPGPELRRLEQAILDQTLPLGPGNGAGPDEPAATARADERRRGRSGHGLVGAGARAGDGGAALRRRWWAATRSSRC